MIKRRNSLPESDYQKLKRFFQGGLPFKSLSRKLRTLLKKFDISETALTVGELTKITQLKTRLVKERVLTQKTLDGIEDSELMTKRIDAKGDFRISDISKETVDPWKTRFEAMYVEAKKSFSKELLSLSELEQHTQFFEALNKEFRSSDSALAKQWRADKGIKREISEPGEGTKLQVSQKEKVYSDIEKFMDGQSTLKQLGEGARSILAVVGEPKSARSSNDQEKLYLLSRRLIKESKIKDQKEWEQFEMSYKGFIIKRLHEDLYVHFKRAHLRSAKLYLNS